jgi:hypothetical protein
MPRAAAYNMRQSVRSKKMALRGLPRNLKRALDIADQK